MPGVYEVLFYNETEDSPGMMLWRYPEPRVLTLVRITPVPFNTTEDPDISTADLGDMLQVWNDSSFLFFFFFFFNFILFLIKIKTLWEGADQIIGKILGAYLSFPPVVSEKYTCMCTYKHTYVHIHTRHMHTRNVKIRE